MSDVETVGEWAVNSPAFRALVDVAAAAVQARRDGFSEEFSNRRLSVALDRLEEVRRDR